MDTGLPISAIWAAAWQARLSWRVVIGCAGRGRETASPAAVLPSTRHAAVRADAETASLAVFAAFTLLDADDHALAVDVADLQRNHLETRNPAP